MPRTEIPGSKRLTYVVNFVSAGDSQHFVHIPNLLNELEALGWDIELVSERGGAGTGMIAGRPFRYLSQTSKTKRLFNLVRTFMRMRRKGGRLVLEAPHGARLDDFPRIRALAQGDGDGTFTLRLGRDVTLGKGMTFEIWAGGTSTLEIGDHGLFMGSQSGPIPDSP